MEGEYTIKICLSGDKNVGKSSLIRQFYDKVFEAQSPTIGMECQTKCFDIDGSKIKIVVWDTSGDQHYKQVFPHYFKGAHGIILAYDITNASTFSTMEEYYNEIKKICGDSVVVLVVGNKSDLTDKREVSITKGEKFAIENRIAFMETSAKSAHRVEEAFFMVTKGTYLIRNQKANSNRNEKKQFAGVARNASREKAGCYQNR